MWLIYPIWLMFIMWLNPPTNFALIPRTIPIDTALENFSYFAIFTRSSMVEQTTPTMHLIYATWRGWKKPRCQRCSRYEIFTIYSPTFGSNLIVHVSQYSIHGAFSGMVDVTYPIFGFRCVWVFSYLGGWGGGEIFAPKKMM